LRWKNPATKETALFDMSLETVESLSDDIREMRRLLDIAKRQNVKENLLCNIKTLEGQLQALKDKPTSAAAAASDNSSHKLYTVKIQSYGWEENDTSVNIRINLPGVGQLSSENICCTFNTNSFDLLVKALGDKNHSLSIKELCGAVDTAQSKWKVKQDTLLITLVKSSRGTWGYLTAKAKAAKETKFQKKQEPNYDNPTDGLMKIMQNLYEEGDDEMKRTIAKAWTESREKGNSF